MIYHKGICWICDTYDVTLDDNDVCKSCRDNGYPKKEWFKDILKYAKEHRDEKIDDGR